MGSKQSGKKRDAIKKTKINKGIKTGVNREAPVRILRLILFIFAAIIAFYPPYLNGLFFEKRFLFTQVLVFAVLLVFFVYKAFKKGKFVIKTPLDYVALALIFVYFISLFASVSLRSALTEWLKYCMYGAVFVVIGELCSEYKTRRALLWVITASASGIALLGIDGAAGSRAAGAINSVISSLGSDIEFIDLFKDARVTSTMQYPNTLAVYLIAAFFITAALSVISDKLWQKCLAGMAGFIMMIAFIFTISRGGYLVFAVVYLLYVILLPKGYRIRGTVNSLIPMAVSGIISLGLYPLITGPTPASSPGRIWLLVAAGLVLTAILTVLAVYVIKWLETLNWKIYIGVFSAAAVICIAGIIFAMTQTEALNLDNRAGANDELKIVTRTVNLRPEAEYKLVFDVEAAQSADQAYAYTILIQSQSKNDLIRAENYLEKSAGIVHSTQLGYLAGNSTAGVEKKTVAFKAPSDSSIVNISFSNYFKGTGAVFDNVYIEDGAGGVIKTLNLKYKYLPEFLAQRLSSFFVNSSTIGRSTYYKDALKLIAERPLLGAGGGAWPLIFYTKQAFYYVTLFPHNYFLQVGVESGILGMLALVFMLLSILYTYILTRKFYNKGDANERIMLGALFVSVVALFGHSFIDFDFAYPAVVLLAWELTALINAQYKNIPEKYGFEYGKGIPGRILNKTAWLTRLKSFRVQPVFGIILAAVITIIPALLLSGLLYYNAAEMAHALDKNDDALKLYKSSIGSDPLNPKYRIDYADFLAKEIGSAEGKSEADRQTDVAIKYGSKDPALVRDIAFYYLETGDNAKGLKYVNRSLELMPLNPVYWQVKVDVYNQLAMLDYRRGGAETSKQSFDTVLDIIGEARTTNARNLFPFKFLAGTSAIIEKDKFMKDNLDSESKINADGVAFYNYPEMDVDLDGLPDQWTFDRNTADVRVNGSVMSAASLDGNAPASIQSRVLYLSKGKTYKIELKLDEGAREDIGFAITGTAIGGVLPDSGNQAYTAEFSTPEEFKAGDNRLVISFAGDVNIKGLKMLEVTE